MTEDFKFEVGATYKNMKGAYEVVSIHRDDMVIRWGDGVELATTVDLQKRIIQRMAYEEELHQRENAEKPEPKKKPKRKTVAETVEEED